LRCGLDQLHDVGLIAEARRLQFEIDESLGAEDRTGGVVELALEEPFVRPDRQEVDRSPASMLV
jgi:hypothetical protein